MTVTAGEVRKMGHVISYFIFIRDDSIGEVWDGKLYQTRARAWNSYLADTRTRDTYRCTCGVRPLPVDLYECNYSTAGWSGSVCFICNAIVDGREHKIQTVKE